MNKIHAAKKFVSNHRVAIAVAATTTVFVVLNVRNTKVLNTFLAEHDLLDLYYLTEAE